MDGTALGACEALKRSGNDAFKLGRLDEAEKWYSEALVAVADAPPGTQQAEAACVVLTNRSNARFGLGKVAESLEDAQDALERNPGWAKAHFRKGAALVQLGRADEAAKAYEDAIASCSPADRAVFEPLLRKAKAGALRPKPLRNQPLPSPAAKRQSKKMPSLYPDEPGAAQTPEEREAAAAKRNLKRLRDKLAGGGGGGLDNDMLLDGLFSKLLDPERFRRIVYRSGAPPSDPGMPASFQALMANELYMNALVALFPKIRAKADSVLANVKAKAAKEGQIMDPATEQMLRPQVLNEAFAHQIVDMIHDVNRKQNAILAQTAELAASPDADEAHFDQLPPAALQQLLDDAVAHCVVDGFLDDDEGEWCELLRAEVADLAAAGALEPRDVASVSKQDLLREHGPVASLQPAAAPGHYRGCRSAWLSLDALERDGYHALHELATRVLALPHELNKKAPQLRLTKPLAANAILLCVGPDPATVSDASAADPTAVGHFLGYAERLDGSFGKDDNGFKLTAVYTFNNAWAPEQGGHLCLKHRDSTTLVEPRADRLVIWRSRVVSNSVEPLCASANAPMAKLEPRLSVAFLLNGPADNANRTW